MNKKKFEEPTIGIDEHSIIDLSLLKNKVIVKINL